MRRCFAAGFAAAVALATPAASEPARSAAGVIAFASNRSPWLSDHVFTAAVDGSRLRVLRRGTKPAVSPDGRRIAFLVGTVGTPTSVWVMNRDETHARAVAQARGSDQLADVPPSWSPDGTRLLYYLLGPDLRIIDVRSGGTSTIRNAFAASWSPDARRIVYVSSGAYPETLVVSRPDGSAARTLVREYRGGTPAWSPDGRWIAYTNADGRVFDLFLVRPDGTATRRLTHDAAFESAPTWSPDGKRLAFLSLPISGRGATLRVLDLRRGRFRTLVNATSAPPGAPVWSRDGRMIAFRSEARLYIVRSTGGRVRRLRVRSPAEAISAAPAWLGPRRLLFSARLRRSDFELYTMHADGSHVRAVTHDHVDELDPAWSPDGSRLAFVRGRKRGAVCTIRTDGTGAHCLSRDGANYAPAWSPDGRRIAFVRDLRLWLVSPRGGTAQELPVPLDVYPGGLSWSPDGSGIVFGSRGSLYVVDVATAAVRQLTNGNGGDGQPAWSPDGRRIVFRGAREPSPYPYRAEWGLYELDPAVGEASVRKILTGFFLHPSWSPDGSRLAFTDAVSVYTASSDGTGVRKLTSPSEFSIRDEHPVWRP